MPTLDTETVTEHYLVAALWLGHAFHPEGHPESDLNPVQLDEFVASIHDLPEEVWSAARADVFDFMAHLDSDDVEEYLEADRHNATPSEQMGHDFYLTRCGHGAGFWDRGLGELGDRLSEAARPYGEVSLFGNLGTDGRPGPVYME
ncbi:hypothetical protein RHODO2019_10780 [Rhodococcus antarcticus]|uniref:Uncharacterized protein n=1 Tax=Rhodococcus antarcticus TaxID=2987751 RepID=A0ABY6NWC0_9NOCA|nr:hypothetical protein [Rhodococcus antarcticus]UZJ23692.1 hypothetical protein RHODO2019_10780 [Rhodococcus antarcticus]